MAELNSNSLYEKNSRYQHGGVTESTTRFLGYWDRKIIPTDVTDSTYVIEDIYEFRPDKLAAVMYGDSRLWWLILQINGILDIPTEFVEGRSIVIPNKERVFSEILTGKVGGIESKRKYSPINKK